MIRLTYRLFKRYYFFIFNKKIIGFNNLISISKSSIVTNCKLNINGSNNKIVIGDRCSLNNVSISIFGNNNSINLSENISFFRGGNLWIEDDFCIIELGCNTTIEDIHIAATETNSKVIVGKDCMFSYDIDIRTGDSHAIIDLKTGHRSNAAKNVVIGDHVWISAHSSILKGAILPADSIVATRSVVTKPFTENGLILGGSPARIIKSNVTWNRDRLIT